jgi:hypothetical protein
MLQLCVAVLLGGFYSPQPSTDLHIISNVHIDEQLTNNYAMMLVINNYIKK